jgi:hypothetical protein
MRAARYWLWQLVVRWSTFLAGLAAVVAGVPDRLMADFHDFDGDSFSRISRPACLFSVRTCFDQFGC